MGCFSPSWGGQGVRCRAAAQRPSLHPPARPAPRSPRLFPSAAAAFALIYISTQLQSRAPSPAGEEGQDRDGEITRGGGEGHPPAGRAAFLGGGWCLCPSSAPSVRPGTPHTPLWGSRGALVTPQLRAPQILLQPRRGAGGCSPRGTHTQQRTLPSPHHRQGFLEVSKLCAEFPSQPGLGAKAGPQQCRRCPCPPPLPQFPFPILPLHDPVQG